MHSCIPNQDQEKEYLVPQLSLHPSQLILLWKGTIFFLLLLFFFVTKKKSCESRTKNFCLPITHFSLVVTYFLIIDNSQNPEINIDTILLTLLQTLSQLFHYSSFSDPGFKPGSHIVSCFYLPLVYANLGQFLCLSCLSWNFKRPFHYFAECLSV